MLQIFSLLVSLLSRASAARKIEPAPKLALTENKRKRVYLNNSLSQSKDNEVVVIGSVGAGKEQKMRQQLRSGNVLTMNCDGSSIIRNPEGRIIKTCDVTRAVREYGYEDQTGTLMVKRLGLWTTPENARLDDKGTLYFTRDGVEFEERLCGLHIQRNPSTGTVIQTHHHKNFRQANGQISKRDTSNDRETFIQWLNGKLTFRSETYNRPQAHRLRTPCSSDTLNNVSRFEQYWKNGQLVREKFMFHNRVTGGGEVKTLLQLPAGSLVVRGVSAITTNFENDSPVETTYQLLEPLTFKVDIPSMEGELEDIVKVRNFFLGTDMGLCFESQTGDEYVVFVGARGQDTRARGAAAADVIEKRSIDGMRHADLVLR